MNNPGLIKTFIAGAAIAPYRIVKFGADDDHVIQSAAATDRHFAVSAELGADAAEDRIDVVMNGAPEVEYGGTVTRGQQLTSDASGRAVAASSENDRVVGIAMVSGVAGDIGSLSFAIGAQVTPVI